MDLSIARLLLSCENPFKWKPHDDLETVREDIINILNDQLQDRVFDCGFQFEQIIIYIALGYEYSIARNLDKALEVMEIGEKKLRSLKDNSTENKLFLAIEHIFLSTKVNLLIMKNNQEAIVIAAEVPEIHDTNDRNRADLLGLKGVFFGEYGIPGSRRALKYISNAIELYSNESLWYFLKGKYLSRIRRADNPHEIPMTEEILMFEKALEMNRNAVYMVFIAQSYRESASQIYRRNYSCLNVELINQMNRLNEKSLRLYRECLNLKPNCPHMMFRCAKGLIMLPPRYRDEILAKELLENALKIAPDSGYGNHVMAQYYERVKKDFPSAIEHLKVCEQKKIFGAAMDLLRLEYRAFRKCDHVVSTLKRYYEEYPEAVHRCRILSQLASYHIFKNSNLVEACDAVKNVLCLNPQFADCLHHRPFFIFSMEAFNLFDLIIDEIKIAMRKDIYSDSDRNTFNELLNEIRIFGIPERRGKPIYLKKKIFDASRRNSSQYHSESHAKLHFNHHYPFEKVNRVQDVDEEFVENKTNVKNLYHRMKEDWMKNAEIQEIQFDNITIFNSNDNFNNEGEIGNNEEDLRHVPVGKHGEMYFNKKNITNYGHILCGEIENNGYRWMSFESKKFENLEKLGNKVENLENKLEKCQHERHITPTTVREHLICECDAGVNINDKKNLEKSDSDLKVDEIINEEVLKELSEDCLESRKYYFQKNSMKSDKKIIREFEESDVDHHHIIRLTSKERRCNDKGAKYLFNNQHYYVRNSRLKSAYQKCCKSSSESDLESESSCSGSYASSKKRSTKSKYEYNCDRCLRAYSSRRECFDGISEYDDCSKSNEACWYRDDKKKFSQSRDYNRNRYDHHKQHHYYSKCKSLRNREDEALVNYSKNLETQAILKGRERCDNCQNSGQNCRRTHQDHQLSGLVFQQEDKHRKYRRINNEFDQLLTSGNQNNLQNSPEIFSHPSNVDEKSCETKYAVSDEFEVNFLKSMRNLMARY